MLTQSGAVCSRDVNCGGLRQNVDRAAINQAWERERDRRFVAALPTAEAIGRDKHLDPMYRLGDRWPKVWRVMNLCEADSGVVKTHVPKLPPGSILGRLKIGSTWWVCVFTDGSDPEDNYVPDDLRERVSNAHLQAKFLNLEADLS